MGLQAKPPPGIPQAVIDRSPSVGLEVRAIHRLEGKVVEGQFGESFRRCLRLRVDQLELVSSLDDEFGPGLGADAHPVEAGGRGYCADYAAERLYRDVRVDRIWEGTSEIMRSIIVRGVMRRDLGRLLS